MLKLMYITNRPEVAQIAESAGADRIFVDLEYIGKTERQNGMDTVQSRHTLEDVRTIANAITMAQLLVRVNPIHEATEDYCSSEEEIDTAIRYGGDIIMLPYFKTLEEVKLFLRIVDGRAQTMLLLETPEAVELLDDLLELEGIDSVHIGLNDLSIGYGKRFMFELLSDGTVERLCMKCKEKGIPYGFGGIASIGKGRVPAEMIIREHYRLGSTSVILSRSFCDVDKLEHLGMINATFIRGVREIREFEAACEQHIGYFVNSKRELDAAVSRAVSEDAREVCLV